jgi:hypothetical protein
MELSEFYSGEFVPTDEPLLLQHVPANESGAVLVGFPRHEKAYDQLTLAVHIAPGIERITVEADDGRKIQIADAQPVATSVLKPYVFKDSVDSVVYHWRKDIGNGIWTYDPAPNPENMVNPSLFRNFSAKICIGAIMAQRRLRNN